MRSFALLLVFVGLVYSRHPRIRQCGIGVSKAEFVYIDIDPCYSDPCVIKRGRRTRFSISVIPRVNSETIVLDGRFKFLGLNLWIPGLETDLCRFISCPVVAGRTYETSLYFSISKWAPPMLTTVTYKVIGEAGELGCITTDVRIV
ncbi:mite group 2 allergen-like Ixo r 2 [Ornithodoros turicata]|uniref:mite group 2 allergen-like Ixo r 2 n=1 Tax=Ornithodoros turicata TaxID=34597 RepID=UPI00313906F0